MSVALCHCSKYIDHWAYSIQYGPSLLIPTEERVPHTQLLSCCACAASLQPN